MNDKDIAFLRKAFKKYYLDTINHVPIPKDIVRREFGTLDNKGFMKRHITLKSDGEFQTFLMQNTPADYFMSNDYYLSPEMPLKNKDWTGADLIFDIDFKDLKQPCRPDHTLHICKECEHIYQKETQCPKCESKKSRTISLPCNKCLKAAKHETQSLLDTLQNDFGIGQSACTVYFSGNEGFHIHVESTEYNRWNNQARNMFANYFIQKGIRIDVQVTNSIHHVFRMPHSVNMKSGMVKLPVPNLESFDPYTACTIHNEPAVAITYVSPIDFKLGTWDVVKSEPDAPPFLAPVYVAVYLICKGLAHVWGKPEC